MSIADQLLEACEGSTGPLLLTGPADPDGDSLGASLALARVLRSRGVDVSVAGVPGPRYAWMPDAHNLVPEAELLPAYDGVVVLDGDRHRLHPSIEAVFHSARWRGIVDHHGSTTNDGYDNCWVEADATSTCDMLFRWLNERKHPLDHALATQLYVGTLFDTGGFRFSNTHPHIHRMAATLLEHGVEHVEIAARVLAERPFKGLRATGLVWSRATLELDGRLGLGSFSHAEMMAEGLLWRDLEGIVDGLVHIEGADVGVLLCERAPGLVKASLRSRGAIDVAAVANTLVPSGGGHQKAGGAMVPNTTIEAVREQLLAALALAFAASPA